MTNVPTIQNPCCFGISLQSGTKIIAAVHIGFLILGYLLFNILFFMEEEDAGALGFVFWIIMTIVCGIILGFHVHLFLAANQRSLKKLKVYLIYFAIHVGLAGLVFVYKLLTWGNFVVTLISCIPLLYQGLLVHAFYKEVSNEGTMASEQLQ